MNVFEGARRITKIIAAVIVIATGLTIYDAASLEAQSKSNFFDQFDASAQPADQQQKPWEKYQKLSQTDSGPSKPATLAEKPKTPTFKEVDYDPFAQPETPWWAKRWLSPLMWGIVSLIALWIFCAATGWIVRGFFDIPAGKDRRLQ